MPRHSEATLAAIKNGVDIVALARDYGLDVTRSGSSKYKALCPFHDDHNPSLELNPDRQSFKCWSCGAGGDVFDFVKDYDRVDFPEALRMLADRAGIALEVPASDAAASSEASVPKSELLAANAWAEGVFAEALARSGGAKAYVAARGITSESVARFKLGYAPTERGWLIAKAKRAGFSIGVLERAGLVSQPDDAPGLVRERFRGRLIFPIHDVRGRAIGFGGRVLPELERILAASGKNVAKYLNSPETPLFHKRRILYGGDLARTEARGAGWVTVVEGYTDVIAAHQVGLRNVVGTLGTALGDDHVQALRRLADRVVLVFDGDDAGQKAADRALEIFLGHEVDVRVLTLPEMTDPCEFLLTHGAEAFRALVEKAVDPLAFVLKRAEARFDFGSIEDARRAAGWVLEFLARVPPSDLPGRDVKVDKALDLLGRRLQVPKDTLKRNLQQIRRTARQKLRASAVRAESAPARSGSAEPAVRPHVRIDELDPTDRELVRILLNEPNAVGRVIAWVGVDLIRDTPLRTILGACYDLYGEGEQPTFERVALRLSEEDRTLAAGLLLSIERGLLPDDVRPAPWEMRLARVLTKLAERDRRNRLRDLEAALTESSETDDPVAHRALQTEYRRLLTQRPDTKPTYAS